MTSRYRFGQAELDIIYKINIHRNGSVKEVNVHTLPYTHDNKETYFYTEKHIFHK